MKALSVVMVSAGFHPTVGGAERQALELSAALVARGHRVTVLTRRLSGLPRRETVRGVAVERLPGPGCGPLDAPVFLSCAFARLLLRREWDAVHAHLAGSPALAAAAAGRLLGRPAVVKLGGGRGIGELAASARTRLGRAKLAALAALRPRLIAVAEDLADEAREFLPGAEIEVLPNGVDEVKFAPAGAERKNALRRALGWDANAFHFLYTGRFSPEKRLPWFLRAWRAQAGERERAVLVGAGAQRDAVLKAADGDARVLVLDAREELADLYAAADAFFLPSLSEGLSNSLLEAMSSGLAIVASRVGGSAEAVVDGRSGLLFDRDDEAALSSAIRRLRSEPGLAERLGAEARREVLRRYSLAAVVARLEKMYLPRA